MIKAGLKDVKNFHLPLPDKTYAQLRAQAERVRVPATTLARDAIEEWLVQQLRKARHDQITAYATKVACTDLDLCRDLESAAIEHLVKNRNMKHLHRTRSKSYLA